MTTTVPVKQVLHRIGFYSNQEGIAQRYLREDDNWKEHLSRTKKFIMNAIRKVQPQSVTVLGSGWLLDIPLGQMVKEGIRVRLADVVHPPPVINSLASETLVEFITCDITGGLITAAYKAAPARGSVTAEEAGLMLEQLDFSPDFEPGMVLSVNLLSQLASLPVEYLEKKRKIEAGVKDLIIRHVQERHLNFLKKHSSVLITDFAEISTSRTGVAESTSVIRCRLPAGKMRSEWRWEFDSGGSYRQGYKTAMEVVALYLGE